MDSFYTPDCPLGLEVQKLLIGQPDGLSVADLRRKLRRQGQVIEEHNLRELLAYPDVFVNLAGDRFCLLGFARQISQDTKPVKPKVVMGTVQDLLLANLPLATKDYIVLDLETTGLDPNNDQIIQLVAIKFQNGKPVIAINYYFNPSPVVIPFSVKLKLGLDRFREVATAINHGHKLAEIVPTLKEFLKGFPIITHNARFDRQFINKAFLDPDFIFVDTLELALLLFPALNEHKLEILAGKLGVTYQECAEIWQQAKGETLLTPIGQESLHNAITDTTLLAGVYHHLLQIWQAQPVNSFYQILLPESYGNSWEPGGAIEVNSYFEGQWQQPNPPVQRPEILARYVNNKKFTDYLDEYRYRSVKKLNNRPGQEEMLELVGEALEQNRFKMIEAPTGTGKTLAYLIPAIVQAGRIGEPVVISTAYRNLQDQLLREIEEFRQSSQHPFRYQVLKGTANYICNDRLIKYAAALTQEALLPERFVLVYLLGRLLTAPDSTFDDLSFWVKSTFEVANHVYQSVSAANGACHDQRCGEFGCALLRATSGAKASHLLIINHDLWLADPARLPSFRFLILDEAHTLEDVATRAFTQEVSRASLEDWFNRLEDIQTGQGALPRLMAQTHANDLIGPARQILGGLRLCRNLTVDFGQHLAGFIQSCQGKLNPGQTEAFRLEADPRRVEAVRWDRVENARYQLFEIHLAEINTLLLKLIGNLQTSPDFPYKEQSLEELQMILDGLISQAVLQNEIIRANNRKQVYWIETEPESAKVEPENTEQPIPKRPRIKNWALKTSPIRIDERLQEYYRSLDGLVLVSATLTLRGGDFSFFVDRLGLGERLGETDTQMVQGDLDYAANAFLGLANYLDYTPTEKTMQSFQDEFGKELQYLLEFTGGRALALFTARYRMEEAYNRCVTSLAQKGIPIFFQEAGVSRRRLQEDFATRIESVLMGLQSFWEGVDVPGESLSFVIMEKMPFPFMFDPVFKARREEVMQRGQHEFNDFIFPLMAIRFKQGFGRLLRDKNDRGGVILLDKRLHRKTYKYELLASLPGFMPRDETQERSRRAFYQAIAKALPDVINLAGREDFLAGLPDELALDLEQKLAEFQLPQFISEADYQKWRPVLLQALQQIFKFQGFRSEEQEQVIKAMLTGQDVLALLPTGAGKSLCFQLTALLRKGLTVVFSPLIALMRDQVQSLHNRGIELVGAIYNGQNAAEREEIMERIRKGKTRLVYISPERLRDPQLLHSLAQAEVSQVVVDEAHCVAMWGPSFRPDFLYLPRLFNHLKKVPPVAAFTATATLPIRQEVVTTLEMRNPTQVVASFDRPELRLVVYNSHSNYNHFGSRNGRFSVLLRILQAADKDRAAILVYVATTVEAEQVARRLQQAGYDARAYHGKLTTADRNSVQELFMEDHINIVVCTKAFGMGIDKPDIRYVIHYHTPGDLESYYQEAGRAGRDGKESYCVLLHHPADRNIHDFFIENGRVDPYLLNQIINKLQQLPGSYLNPLQLGEELGLDEVQLKIGLHLLEKSGYIERGPDFTLQGNLTLLANQLEIENYLRVTGLGNLAKKFEEIAQYEGWPVYRQFPINFLELTARHSITPEVLDNLLISLAAGNLALYRPWEKGFIIQKKEKLHSGNPFSLPADQSDNFAQQKLKVMFDYAEAGKPNRTIRCRRAYILNYFGQTTPVENCGSCDLCVPEYAYPWSEITGRDTALTSDYFDPAFVILELAKWNLDLTRLGHNPYGKGMLAQILRGNSYQIGKYYPDPALRHWKLRILRGCPYWGIFEGLPRADQVIEKTFLRLLAESYVEETSRTFVTSDGPHTYNFVNLLPKGRDQLLRGELLRWESD